VESVVTEAVRDIHIWKSRQQVERHTRNEEHHVAIIEEINDVDVILENLSICCE
jgi:hypothetical protein